MEGNCEITVRFLPAARTLITDVNMILNFTLFLFTNRKQLSNLRYSNFEEVYC